MSTVNVDAVAVAITPLPVIVPPLTMVAVCLALKPSRLIPEPSLPLMLPPRLLLIGGEIGSCRLQGRP